MSDDWDFYLAWVGDEPASVFVDLGIAPEVPVGGYECLGALRVAMQAPRPDGLSSDQEYGDLIALEDAIVPQITAGGAALYVGRYTTGGNRDFFFYSRDAAQFETAARAAMESFVRYRFRLGSHDDAEWQTYWDSLYPPPEDIQRVLNRRVCNQLKENGDTLVKPRTIDHCVRFDRKQALERFVAYVEGSGYAVIARHEPDGGNSQYSVEFSRHDSLDDIDAITIELSEKAAEMAGDYDGWGCTVVS